MATIISFKEEPRVERTCSFCHRKESEVKRLIEGKDANICDACIAQAARRAESVEAA